MSSTMLFLLILSLIFNLTARPTAEGWRGIVPLHSTREDVERLLGPGKGECKCNYYLDDINVFFVYSSGSCQSDGSGSWNVPVGTVLRITVHHGPDLRWSNLNIDKTKFTEKHEGHIESIVSYVSDGLFIEVNKDTDTVEGFYYGPSSKNEYLKCPGYENVSFPSEITKESGARLLERVNDFVEYGRTEQYEKQYELFLPELARLMFPVKNKDEFAKWVRSTGAFKETWIEFKPLDVSMVEDGNFGKAYSIYGRAKVLENGKIVESSRETRAVIRKKEWYLIDIFNLAR